MKRELDIQALYAAVESKKSELRLSWSQLAFQLEFSDHTVFTRMARGQVPQTNTLLTLSAWLGSSLDDFAYGEVVAHDARRETMDAINSFLRADEHALAPESSEAIEAVLKAAQQQLVERQRQRAAAAARVD